MSPFQGWVKWNRITGKCCSGIKFQKVQVRLNTQMLEIVSILFLRFKPNFVILCYKCFIVVTSVLLLLEVFYCWQLSELTSHNISDCLNFSKYTENHLQKESLDFNPWILILWSFKLPAPKKCKFSNWSGAAYSGCKMFSNWQVLLSAFPQAMADEKCGKQSRFFFQSKQSYSEIVSENFCTA